MQELGIFVNPADRARIDAAFTASGRVRDEQLRFRVRSGQLSGDVLLTRREFSDVVKRHLPATPGAHVLWLSRLRYRLLNLPRYLTRLKKVGWKTSEEVLSGGA